MSESSIFGVSVRAWLALITVTSGLAFLYIVGILFSGVDGVLITIITAVTGFIGLSLGYYLGQKSTEGVEIIDEDDQP
jgi:hypothetical protein